MFSCTNHKTFKMCLYYKNEEVTHSLTVFFNLVLFIGNKLHLTPSI